MKKILILLLIISTNLYSQIFQAPSKSLFYSGGQDSILMIHSGALKLGRNIYFVNDGISGLRRFNSQLQFSNDLVNWYTIPTSLTQGGGWTLGSNKIYQSTANTKVHITTQANDTIGNSLLNVYGNGMFTRGSLYLDTTRAATQYGVIYKNNQRFIHDFNYGYNGTVTTAGNNTFVGEGSGNFTMGANATQLYQSSNNSAFGSYAFTDNTTGYENSAFGRLALKSNNTGLKNSAFGAFALQNNTSGFKNTAIGCSALADNTTGYSNTAIGVEAGRYIYDGSTPNRGSIKSVYIGMETKALADGGINEIVIGYNAIGAGSNSVVLGNDNITKTILKGNVGIGATAPTAKLDINGSTGYNQLRLRTSYTPTGSNDTNGNIGDITWDDNYLYIKTNQGWKRVTLSSF